MLFEINDDVKDLAGGTKAREALVRLGQQYLNKEAATQTDPRRRRELAEAFVKVGDLQGAPGESNLRDVSGARQSYSRSVAILEGDVVSQPHDPGLRHLMTLAYVRQAQLEESASSAKTFGAVVPTFATSWAQLDESASAAVTMLERASKSADIYLAQWPADPQGLRDRCEVLQAKDEFAPAVELRQRILAASPNDPVLHWELAHAQIAFGSSLVLKNRRKALDWLQKGAAACDLLNKEDPANVRYLRDRAVALGSMTRVLLNLSRLDEAVACARESVSILEQLTASDRRSASFRLDLSAARVALSNAYYDSGQASLALENVARAAAVQEDQAARYPDNPDFPRQAAYNFRNAGRFKSYMKDFQGALEQYRKAEAIDRKLVARYPDRHELSEALRGDLDSIASSLLGLGDNSAALRAWRDALAIAQAAAAAPSNSQPTGESLVSLAMAHQGVSNGLRAMSRWDEAIVEQRAAVAIWERRVAGKPDNQGLQRARSRSLEDLSRLYESHGDFPAAVAASEKARVFLAADFAAHPDDESALTELRNALLCLRTQYARIADYDRAITAARQVVEMTKSTGVISRTAANRDLGDTLLLSGRRPEALASFRRAVATMDDTHTIPGGGQSYPIEKEPSSFYRNELASTFLSLVAAFTSARREEESAALLKRLVPVVENLARANPGNNLYRETLLRAYRSATAAFLGLGDLANSLDFEQKGLHLEPSSPTPGRAVYERAVRLTRAAFLQFRLGSRDAAQKTWREALARFQQAANDSNQQWSADHQDQNAHDTLVQAGIGAAVALENLGGPQRTQPLAADIMDTFAIPIPARLDVAAKSLDVTRRRMMSDPSTPNRVALARALQYEGDALRAAARCGKGTESISAYRQSRDHYTEALAILDSLKPSAPVADLITLTNHLSDAEERLR